MGCLAHVRRKFFEAKSNNPPKAEEALCFIGQLYQIEAQARENNFTAAQRHQLRQEKAKPIWDTFVQWLNNEEKTCLPASAFGKAITYALNEKCALAIS